MTNACATAILQVSCFLPPGALQASRSSSRAESRDNYAKADEEAQSEKLAEKLHLQSTTATGAGPTWIAALSLNSSLLALSALHDVSSCSRG